MGPGGTGGHNGPVEALFLDDFGHLFLTVGGTGEEKVIGINHTG